MAQQWSTSAQANITSAEQMRQLGYNLAQIARGGDVIALSGALGAGKTTLAQGFGAGLGISEPIVSPTFTIARELTGRTASGEQMRLIHVDAYRLGGAEFAPGQDHVDHLLDTLESLGLDEAVDHPAKDTIILLEWGEQMAAALTQERLSIHITRSSSVELAELAQLAQGELSADGVRQVSVQALGERWAHFDAQALLASVQDASGRQD